MAAATDVVMHNKETQAAQHLWDVANKCRSDYDTTRVQFFARVRKEYPGLQLDANTKRRLLERLAY